MGNTDAAGALGFRTRMDRWSLAVMVLPLAALVLLAMFAAAGAEAKIRERTTVVNVPPARDYTSNPGTSPNVACPEGIACNKVWVRQFGPRKSKRVLILVPGTFGGAGTFTLIARDIVRRVKGLQVWALDRRSQALELTRDRESIDAFRATLATRSGYEEMLGRTIDAATTVDTSTDGVWAKHWGLATAINDLHTVVLKARKAKMKVSLGGHSLGGSIASAYSTWDFGGKPGHSFIRSLVLIDGGGLSQEGDVAADKASAETAVTNLASSPWGDLLGLGVPTLAGVFAENAGIFARLRPRTSAAEMQEKLGEFGQAGARFNPEFPVTNRALLGNAFDQPYPVPESDPLGLLRVNSGSLGPESQSPRDWADGGVTPIDRVAQLFGQEPVNAVEWYFPTRLSVDSARASLLSETEATGYLGLRVKASHLATLADPVYVVQTTLTSQRLIARVSRMKGASRVNYLKAVDASAARLGQAAGHSHLDPLVAAPRKNLFLKTVVPFLKKRAFR